MRTGPACLTGVAGIALALVLTAPPLAAESCAPGAQCFSVTGNGTPGTGSVAQCTGRFPDFIVPASMIPAGFAGPWFKLAQDFPVKAPAHDAPWLKINFMAGTKGANAYLYALRDYSFDGMIEADFRPENNTRRRWLHMPMMNFGDGRREPMRGLTQERHVKGPELGVKPGVILNNYAVGFYNQAGGISIGRVWKTDPPDPKKSGFARGTMTFKILFSDARPEDFTGVDILAGAPEFVILTPAGQKTVRLLQMDVSAADPRSPTGWVFGTFAYQPAAKDPSPWNRLRPVGLSWGNDPGITPNDIAAGRKLKQSIISDEITDYAAAHLGWAGRTNGPVDNPISGCLSCHGTAQAPVVADLAPFDANCDSDAKKLAWFRNFKSPKPFGAISRTTCQLAPMKPAPVSLDFSLQMQVGIQAVLELGGKNPCAMIGKTTQGGGRVERK